MGEPAPKATDSKTQETQGGDKAADASNIKMKADTGGGKIAYGKHATMPVLVSDLYAQVNIPELTEFNPEELKLDGTIVAVGKRRTGKTWPTC